MRFLLLFPLIFLLYGIFFVSPQRIIKIVAMEEIRKYPVGMQTLLICHLDDDKHPAEDFDAACKGIQECLLTLEAMGKFITTMYIA